MTNRLRVFPDANVIIRAITFPRFPYEVLRHAARGDFLPVLSPLVLDSVRLYVREFAPECQEALEALLTLLDYELAPDPPPDEVSAHTGLCATGTTSRSPWRLSPHVQTIW